MLGKLTLSAIPFHSPIVMGAVGGSLLAGLVILGLITYHRKWPYLWREWITTCDHKRIGMMYIILALVMLVRGLSDAIMMRLQQALATGGSMGYLTPDHFNQIFSAHGSIMIIFMAMPFLVGLMNIVVPPQIGSRDVAFPFMNAVSFWLTAAGTMLVMASLGIGEFSKAGWSGYTSLTEKQFSPDTGVDYWIWAFQIAGVGSTLSSVNFLATIFKMRAPGMTFMRMPMFTWTSLFTSVLMLFAFPVLTAALLLLTLDRYLGMHFFSNDLGGNMMMYVNLFWTWGHPEVYIVVLPAFGVFSEVTSTFSGKRLFGYRSMVYATAAITVVSFAVWLHHFFTMGASPPVNIFFGIATMLISIPTGVKIYNWLFTMYRGRIRFTTPMYWTVGFLMTFSIGGMSGVLLASPPANYVVHNSLFVIAHFHNVLIAGTLFGFLAGYSYWFPKAIGFKLDEKWGKLAFWCWLTGFYMAFMPLYVLGFMGMPRRMHHFTNAVWHPWLILAAIGTAVIVAGVFCLGIQLVVSIRNRKINKDITGDPWDGRTLEWSVSSPPPEYNFAHIPVVNDLDAFTDMKERGTAYVRHERYFDILLPANSASGPLIGLLAFMLGFGMTWYIWWLAIAGVMGIIIVMIMRMSDDNTERVVTADEIGTIERKRHEMIASARNNEQPLRILP
ncbi:MAG: cytochrome o ubiquinol oxidase subunit I [Syntrophorhabdaceae bacterium]